MRLARAALIPLFMMLASCGRSTGPAPVISYGVSGGADSAGMHTIQAGDTPWTIAQDYGLSMQDIIAVNKLQPPYRLTAGQRLRLPPPSAYTARAGDTLYSISHTFSVSPAQLAKLNALDAPYAVHPGQTVRMPSIRPAAAPVPAPAPFVAPPQQQQQHEPTLVWSKGLPPAQPETSAPAPVVAQSEVDRDIADEGRLAMARPVQQQPAAPAQNFPLISNSGGAGRFGWPVGGQLISSYGPKPGGLHNDGINIRAPRGAPVRAAEGGEVVYAGDELKGFGNLVLLRHADRWMTAYAHMDRLLVTRGQKVVRGQAIGAVGATGSVDEPQLHFEIRRGTEALNPVLFMARP